MTKAEFLDKYNQSRTIEEALSKAISAAVQRNKLYLEVNNTERKLIREYWSKYLTKLYERYIINSWDENAHEKEIIKLKYSMNTEFGQLVDFRISHSQKSIGVFFKHLWCLEQISDTPQCPVDRKILTKADAPIYERSWGYVNDVETHRRKYQLIKQKSITDGFNNISQWELENFDQT